MGERRRRAASKRFDDARACEPLRVRHGDPTNEGCAARVATGGLPRSRPAAEAYLAATFLQWVRFQVGATWYPPYEGAAGTWAIHPMLGLEVDLPL